MTVFLDVVRRQRGRYSVKLINQSGKAIRHLNYPIRLLPKSNNNGKKLFMEEGVLLKINYGMSYFLICPTTQKSILSDLGIRKETSSMKCLSFCLVTPIIFTRNPSKQLLLFII